MTLERAMEILNPKHREHYDSIETVNEACRIGMQALEKQIPKKVEFINNGEELLCPNCGINFMGTIDNLDHSPYYCFECGQALDWEQKNDR